MIHNPVKVKANGTFIKKENTVFRPEAYLQFGNSEEVVGTVVMLNPGSARLEKSLINNQQIIDKISIDPTLKHLIEILEEAYPPEKLVGRVYIYNLFSLQDGNKSSSIQKFLKLWKQDEPFVKELPKPRHELLNTLQESSWVLLGWGSSDIPAQLKTVIKQWSELIAESKTPIIGKMGKSKFYYYHPKPQLHSMKTEYKALVVSQLRNLIQSQSNETNYNTLTNETVDQSWIRHVNYYEPVKTLKSGYYTLDLYELNESGRPLNYIYRLMIFDKDQKSPVLTFNYEKSFAETYCLAVTKREGRINLGSAPNNLSTERFIEWIKGIISEYIPALDMQILNNLKSSQASESNSNELLRRRKKMFLQNVREFEDRYEYIILKDYESLEFEEIHSIPLKDVSVTILLTKNSISLVSIEIKNNVTLEQFYEWLQIHSIYFENTKDGPHVIKGCDFIEYGLKFMDHLIILYKRGTTEVLIDPAEYTEVSEDWDSFSTTIDPTKVAVTQAIYLNGQNVKQFEPMFFDISKDLIISNGQQINASCIKIVNQHLTFFHPEIADPIANIATNQTIITINTLRMEQNAILCTIEFDYILNFELD